MTCASVFKSFQSSGSDPVYDQTVDPGTADGAVLTFSCAEGYMPVVSPKRTCTGGVWVFGGDPACEEIPTVSENYLSISIPVAIAVFILYVIMLVLIHLCIKNRRYARGKADSDTSTVVTDATTDDHKVLSNLPRPQRKAFAAESFYSQPHVHQHQQSRKVQQAPLDRNGKSMVYVHPDMTVYDWSAIESGKHPHPHMYSA